MREGQRIRAEDWPALLAPGMRVFLHGSTSEPLALRAILEAAASRATGVDFTIGIVPGVNEYDYAALAPAASMTTGFVTPSLRASFAAGRIRFLPLNYTGFHDYLAAAPPFDLAVLQVAPPDADGRMSLGVSTDFPSAILPRVRRVLVQLNEAMPRIADGPFLAAADLLVESTHALPEFPEAAPDATQTAIANNAASLIRDGDCLQIGIGKIQSAILGQLKGHRRLGFHSGLMTDAVLDLMEAGAMSGEAKSRDRGLAVTGLAVGTRRLYEALARLPVAFREARYTHGTDILAGIDNFVSINSAIEIDLFGQCNAEMLGGRQVSGTGGFADFVRGARLSRSGRSIVALPATAAGGRHSRIRARLDAGTAVTGARSDTDLVVTEYGIASLKGLSLDQRAASLIAIAAPEFRAGLQAEWDKFRASL
ncbi:MAG: 4-hydroxybutyrate CoA-transferase [Alphaproteobacteria bacterium]|nr:4-hydroxybutyrate CoA-transferase [Alphaproteobacteria bacterium]